MKQNSDEEIDTRQAQEEVTELSAIKIFELVRKSVSNINVWPLTPERIDVHEDAYQALASDSEEDYGFAHIGYEYAKKYTDLTFGMIFGKHQVGLSLGNMDFVFNPYELFGDDEKIVAKKLINILIGLANGQLAILNTITQEDERVQAWELLYRQPDKQLYDALVTYNLFESKRKLKRKTLATIKMANGSEIENVDVDLDAYRAFTYETTWLNKFNRTQIAGLHIPLTIEDWEKNVDEYYDEKYDRTLKNFEKRSDKFIKNIDRWSKSDNKTLWQKILDATKWRHLELMWWSLAMLTYPLVADWSLEDLRPAMLVFAAYVIGATIYRRDERFYKHFPFIRASAYMGFALTGFLFYLQFDATIWWYIVAVLAIGSLIESVFFDIYNARHKPDTDET